MKKNTNIVMKRGRARKLAQARMERREACVNHTGIPHQIILRGDTVGLTRNKRALTRYSECSRKFMALRAAPGLTSSMSAWKPSEFESILFTFMTD